MSLVHIYLNVDFDNVVGLQNLLVRWNVTWSRMSDYISKTVSARVRQRKAKSSVPSRVYDLSRVLVVEIDDAVAADFLALVVALPGVESAFILPEEEPLYNPNDPDGLVYALTRQTLTHEVNVTALDMAQGSGMLIGVVESEWNGVNYIIAELGGTGNRERDWQSILDGTHPKFALYTDVNGQPIDPYGIGHGHVMSLFASAEIDNGLGFCGAAPKAKIMFARTNYFDAAIIRLADLGCDVIFVAYGGVASHRAAIQYAVAAGTVVVYAHASNMHREFPDVKPLEALLMGAINERDQSFCSFGIGLSLQGQGVYTWTESGATSTMGGIIALLREVHPEYNVFDCHAALTQTAQKTAEMDGEIWTKLTGYGIPDALAALQTNMRDLRPLPPIDFAGKIEDEMVTLSWTVLPTSSYNGVMVRGKQDEAPVDVDDGILFYEGGDSEVTFTLPPEGLWYFAIWALDADGRSSDLIDFAGIEMDIPPPLPIFPDGCGNLFVVIAGLNATQIPLGRQKQVLWEWLKRNDCDRLADIRRLLFGEISEDEFCNLNSSNPACQN